MPCLFDSEIFGSDFEDSVLTCDVSANLVHCDVLRREGAVAVAFTPPETLGREFVASRDTAFRPTALEHGPDGAIYLADMQRDVIEHPAYIPAHVKKNLNLRAGDDRGRIYRITPKSGLPPPAGSLADARPVEWVRELASPLPWRRVTAHRLLVEKKPQEVFESARAAGRHRRRTEGQGARAVDSTLVGQAVRSSASRGDAREPRRCAGERGRNRQLGSCAIAGDQGRLGGACRRSRSRACGSSQPSRSGRSKPTGGPWRLPACCARPSDPWLIKAALIGVGPDAPTILETTLADESMRERAPLIEPLARLAASFHRPLPFLDQAKPSAALIRGLAAGATEAPPGERAAWAARLEAWASRLPASESAPLFDLAAALNLPAPETLEAVLRQAAARRCRSHRTRAAAHRRRGDSGTRETDGPVACAAFGSHLRRRSAGGGRSNQAFPRSTAWRGTASVAGGPSILPFVRPSSRFWSTSGRTTKPWSPRSNAATCSFRS